VDGITEISYSYYLDKQMLAAIKHITGDNVVFQQDSAPAHWTCNTVQLRQHETLNFISHELWPQQFTAEPCWLQDVRSHILLHEYESRVNNIEEIKTEVWQSSNTAFEW